jgi:hypothetical protein
MLFIQKNSTLPASTVNDFSGGSNSIFSGVVYLPTETFRTGGTSSVGGCIGVVADFVLVQGTPTFSDGCLPGGGITTTIAGTSGTPAIVSSPLLTQ